jgi:hypothetical protein
LRRRQNRFVSKTVHREERFRGVGGDGDVRAHRRRCIAAQFSKTIPKSLFQLSEHRGEGIAVGRRLCDAHDDPVVREDSCAASRGLDFLFERLERRLQQLERRRGRVERAVEKVLHALMQFASHVPQSCGHALLRHLINPNSVAAATISVAIGPAARAP